MVIQEKRACRRGMPVAEVERSEPSFVFYRKKSQVIRAKQGKRKPTDQIM